MFYKFSLTMIVIGLILSVNVDRVYVYKLFLQQSWNQI